MNQPNDLLSEEEYDEILGQVQKSCNLGIDQLIIEEEVQVQTESVEDGQEPIVQTITKKTVRGFFLLKKISKFFFHILLV